MLLASHFINCHLRTMIGLVARRSGSCERILSKYHVVAASETRVSIYVITEWDRRITTILLTEEY